MVWDIVTHDENGATCANGPRITFRKMSFTSTPSTGLYEDSTVGFIRLKYRQTIDSNLDMRLINKTIWSLGRLLKAIYK